MSEKFIDQNIKLLLDFDRYFMRHRKLRDAVPSGATVIMTLEGDEKFNNASRSMVRRSRRRVVEAHKRGRTWAIRPYAGVKK